jgi:hypothetical protein
LGLWVLIQPAFSQEPLPVRNGRAFSLAFLRLAPRTRIVGGGDISSELKFVLANDVRFEGRPGRRVREDYEVARLEFTMRKQLADGLDGEVTIPIQAISGGVLDPLISVWHGYLLGWERNERNGSPHGEAFIESPGNPSFGPAWGLADVRFQLNRSHSGGVLSLGIEAPTGKSNRLLGSGGWEFGVGYGRHAWSRGRLRVFAHVGLVYQGASPLHEENRIADQETVCLEYSARERDKWIIQWSSEASALRTGVPASDAAHRLLTFGFRRGYSDGSRLEIFVMEDRDLFEGAVRALASVGPDLTLGVNWVFRRLP